MGHGKSISWTTAALLLTALPALAQHDDRTGEMIQANATQVQEESPSVTTAPGTPVQGAVAEQVTRHALVEPILAEIARLSTAAKDEPEKTWLTELSTFYSAPEASPLWVYRDGYLGRGWEAVHMLRGADDYGLDPAAFPVTELTQQTPSPEDLAVAEVQLSLAVTRYAWYAAGGRLDPKQISLWLDQPTPRAVYASDVLRKIDDRGDVTAAMRGFHPQNPQFEALRRAYVSERGVAAVPTTTAIAIPPGPVLKRGDRSSDVPLIRKRLDLASSTGDDTLVDRALLGKVREFMYEQGLGRKRVIDDEVRAALSKPIVPRANKAKAALLEKYRVNLERWRWLPHEMGNLYVWNNLPEFETRVMKNGEPIHEERIVIGTQKTQTPVFSDQMSRIIFHPDWGVPESIKIRDLMPRLRAGDFSVLKRRNMRLYANGREIKPSKFNWSKVDARNVPIVQRSGPGNPLGQLKFIFPNAHDVYMHDTPSKGLFNSKERTFSHGCIRVRNPQRFAEVLLAESEGWTAADVAREMKKGDTSQVDLKQPIPVHNTYFTMVADAQGNVTQLKDVYNYDKRMQDALNGSRSLKSIAASDPALALKRENEELKKRVAVIRRPAPRPVPVARPYGGGPPPSFFWFD